MELTMDKLASFCKRTGIVFPGSEIYGGMGNTWDYGPVGIELKNNIKKLWWKRCVQQSENSFGIDTSILLNPIVWEASGHLASFSDPLMDCKECKTRHRADKLIEEYQRKVNNFDVNPDAMSKTELYDYIVAHNIKCPNCGKLNFTEVRNFNLMFETNRGVSEDKQSRIFLRPETAQGEYINFLNLQRTTRAKIPFGVANIGKAFRNEITPGNFTFRTIEFEQMEHQLFCHEKDAMEKYEYYKNFAMQFFVDLGMDREKLRFKDHDKLAHYAKAACDVQYKFPFGWDEMSGTHLRGTWDLSRHQQYSGKSMAYTDPFTNETFIPTVVEHTIGCDRLALALLCDAYTEEDLGDGDTRIVLKLNPNLSAYKICVLPLQKNLSEKAKEVYKMLTNTMMCSYDEAGSIGKRYRRQDEIGTPYCVTIDFDTLNDGCVTIRDRDTMKQERIKIDEILGYVAKKLTF